MTIPERSLGSTLHIFTSAAVNYLPKVRVLCRSIKRHHPEAMVHLALSDERPAWLTPEGEPFDSILEMSGLDIPALRGWTFMHSVVELSTAIKPFALQKLLARDDCRAVLYLDPDMVVFSRLDDILATLERANVALTPHQTKPETDLEHVVDNEITSLRMGVFNLGFVGVAPTAEGKRFAQWWADRCYHYCRAEVHNGLFTDQKWINFAPIFFDGVAIVKSSRHNVATWNLTTRVMTGDIEHGIRVDGEPLGFYHFTGFDSGAHRIMAFKNAPGNEALQQLIAWYDRETRPEASDPVTKTPWAFARFDDGTPILPQHRWVYRDRRDLQAAFPDPYATGGDELTFLEWCRTEGRIRFPEFFTGNSPAAWSPPPERSRVPVGMALRLFLLMFAPHAGRSLRGRMVNLIKREGWRGVARRISGQPALKP
jgi:hypothetical protein